MKKEALIICLLVLIVILNQGYRFSDQAIQESTTALPMMQGKQNSSPYMEKIAFYSTRSGKAQIYVMNTDGSGLQRLTTNSAKDQSPVISPDGTRIAFASDREGVSRIYIMNIDGSSQRRLTTSTNEEILPAWSPDGKSVYFQIEFKGKNSILCSVNAEGGELKRITDGTAGYDYPAISPDGTEILCNGSGFSVFIMSVDGTNPRRIGEPLIMRLRPLWSPDCAKIVYGLLRGMPPNHTTEIGVMNSDGRNDTVITKDNSVNEFPCFSPDGKKIAFQTARDGNFEIYVMNVDGSNPRRLTNDPKFDGAPSWGIVRMPK